MNRIKRKAFATKAAAAGGRKIRFVISDGSVDRDNDRIDPRGWELANYRRNPTVLWGHDSSALPVARAVEVGVKGDRLEAVAEFARHPFAEEVFALYRDKFLSAVSVGFKPIEWKENRQRGGFDFSKVELLEFSCVPIPSNPNALAVAASRGAAKHVRAWARRTLGGGGALDQLDGDEEIEVFDSGDDIEIVDDDWGGSELIDVDPDEVAQVVAAATLRGLCEEIEDGVSRAIGYRRGRV